ncbi:hypothetical protein BT63DRAFT_449305 [Microthyrium microscopicum]|uniref:Uncharacterized protein n=1 Tax=Microthyrium microscopicum TaxID=703497 RepID=A0A6A6UPU5_9PEZI|nr:hypothetical protein BT63DRAFT_449305 [Microthyrium microscopicum]
MDLHALSAAEVELLNLAISCKDVAPPVEGKTRSEDLLACYHAAVTNSSAPFQASPSVVDCLCAMARQREEGQTREESQTTSDVFSHLWGSHNRPSGLQLEEEGSCRDELLETPTYNAAWNRAKPGCADCYDEAIAENIMGVFQTAWNITEVGLDAREFIINLQNPFASWTEYTSLACLRLSHQPSSLSTIFLINHPQDPWQTGQNTQVLSLFVFLINHPNTQVCGVFVFLINHLVKSATQQMVAASTQTHYNAVDYYGVFVLLIHHLIKSTIKQMVAPSTQTHYNAVNYYSVIISWIVSRPSPFWPEFLGRITYTHLLNPIAHSP